MKRAVLRPGTILLGLIALAMLSIGSTLTYSTMLRERVVYSSAVIVSVDLGIYSDAGCNNTLTSIDWGLLYPGSNKTKVIYTRNEGTVNIVLFIEATNWNPETASNHIALSSNYKMQVVKPNQILEIALTIQVASSVGELRSFNFNIRIASAEAT